MRILYFIRGLTLLSIELGVFLGTICLLEEVVSFPKLQSSKLATPMSTRKLSVLSQEQWVLSSPPQKDTVGCDAEELALISLWIQLLQLESGNLLLSPEELCMPWGTLSLLH